MWALTYVSTSGDHEWCDRCRACVWDTWSYSSNRNSTLPAPPFTRGVQVGSWPQCNASRICWVLKVYICKLQLGAYEYISYCACMCMSVLKCLCINMCVFWGCVRICDTEPGREEPVELVCVLGYGWVLGTLKLTFLCSLSQKVLRSVTLHENIFPLQEFCHVCHAWDKIYCQFKEKKMTLSDHMSC